MKQPSFDPSGDRPSQILPVLVLLAIVAVLVGGWLLFPIVHARLAYHYCVSAGWMNCAPGNAPGQ